MPELTAFIKLEASETPVRVGEVFDVRVRIGAGFTNKVDAAQVYLDFDADKLEAVSMRPAGRLEFELQSALDNDEGHAGYAAGTLGYALEFPFTLLTVTFRAKEATGERGTPIDFARLRAPRQTKVVHRGLNVTGELVPARIVVR